jgi:Xaa-Pro dipeptidase
VFLPLFMVNRMSKAIHEVRAARLARVVADQGWDGLVLYGNAWQCDYLRYATDYVCIKGNAIAVSMKDGETRLFVESPLEAGRAETECPWLDVSWSTDAVTAAAAFLDGLGNRKLASAPATLMPYGLIQGRRGAAREDAGDAIDELLLAKADIELDAIRHACGFADRGYQVFMDACRPGRAEYEVVADVEAFFRAEGCPDNFMIMGSGGQEVRGMTPAGERRLQIGDLVTTELTPCVDGYYAQLCRTLVIGEPSQAQLSAHDVYLEAEAAGIGILRAGVTASEVARAENDVFRRHGLEKYTTNAYTRVRGHGVGLFVDSKPHILEDVHTVLPAGATVTVHPNTYHPDVGYMVLGDTSIVTEDGSEGLIGTPRKLLLVPG